MIVTNSDIIEAMKKAGIMIDFDTLAPDSLFRDNGIDSLDMANLLLSIEEKYTIKIPDEDLYELISIDAIENYLIRRLSDN